MNLQRPLTTDNCKLTTVGSRLRRVVHLPVYAENAYQPMLMDSQRKLGWDVIDGGGGGNFLRTALRNWRPDILHVHWLHPYLLRNGALASWARGWRFLAEIALIRRSGTRIVWTVHNLANHAQQHGNIELAMTRRFVRQCDLILTHGNFAVDVARERFRIPDVVPIQSARFPNYCEQYPVTHGENARELWGLDPKQFVVGFLGRVEPYKQVVELVQAFRSVAASDACLLIGGRAADSDYAQEVQRAIDNDTRIRFLNDYVPKEEVASFLTACDVIACSSKGILTSSSVPLAMSFGRAVLAPSEGCIPEEVGVTGFLYDNSHNEGLLEGLQSVITARDTLAGLGESARRRAEEASPGKIAEQIVAGYYSVLL